MSVVRRVAVVTLVVTLVAAGTALAGRYDPRRKLTPADQARAAAMLLRKADLGARFQRQSGGQLVTMPIRCKALDESDLTLTGAAGSYLWLKDSMFVFGATRVYTSTADANASWRRQLSPAGRRCATSATQNQLGGRHSIGLVPFAFPRLAPRTVALRLTVRSAGATTYEDVVVLQRSRGQAFFVVGSSGGAAAKALELRVAHILAARQAKAMRGA